MKITNKKAFFNYEILEKIESGIVLEGCEVKSIREGHMTIHESFVRIKDGELFLVNASVLPYSHGNRNNPPQHRSRKLLLKQRQLNQLMDQIEKKGLSVVPLSVYFKRHLVKVEIGVGKPKKSYDKRASIKERDIKRQIQQQGKRPR